MEHDKAIIRRIFSAIVKQAFDDWEALEYGEWEERFVTGQVIYISELLLFFSSPEFEEMCKYVLRTPIAQIRETMHIPTEV